MVRRLRSGPQGEVQYAARLRQSAIGRNLKTIRKWLKDNQLWTWERTVVIENPSDAHQACVLHGGLKAAATRRSCTERYCDRGYRERVKTFRQWVKVRLRDGILAPALSRASRKSSWRTPSSRQTVRLLTAEVDTLPAKERAFVNAISSSSPEVATAANLARRFQSMVCNREIAALKPWLNDAIAGPMSSFAAGSVVTSRRFKRH